MSASRARNRICMTGVRVKATKCCLAATKTTQVNLIYPVSILGSRKERKGQGDKHATYSIPFASSRSNTGDFVRDGKASGK